jgi:hypothetical protein
MQRDKILRKKTAGGADTQIAILILKIISIHIELAIVRIPVGIDQAGAHPSLALRYPSFPGNQACLLGNNLPQRKTAVFSFISPKTSCPIFCLKNRLSPVSGVLANQSIACGYTSQNFKVILN